MKLIDRLRLNDVYITVEHVELPHREFIAKLVSKYGDRRTIVDARSYTPYKAMIKLEEAFDKREGMTMGNPPSKPQFTLEWEQPGIIVMALKEADRKGCDLVFLGHQVEDVNIEFAEDYTGNLDSIKNVTDASNVAYFAFYVSTDPFDVIIGVDFEHITHIAHSGDKAVVTIGGYRFVEVHDKMGGSPDA